MITDFIGGLFPDEEKDPAYLDEPLPAVEMVDDVNAGFTLALACSEDPLPEDGINCRAVISEGETAYAYTIYWVMDGYTLKANLVPAGSDSFSFPNPPPGTHTITVQAVNSTTNTIRVSTALVNVQYAEGYSSTLAAAAAGAQRGRLRRLAVGRWLASRNKTIVSRNKLNRMRKRKGPPGLVRKTDAIERRGAR